MRSSASNAVDANNDRRCLSWAWYPRPEVRHGGSPTRARVGPHTRRPCDPLSPMRPMPKIQLSGPHPLSRERPHHDSKFYTKSSPPRLKWEPLYNNCTRSVLRSSASNSVDANNDRRCLSWAWYPRPEVRHGGSPTRARVGPHTRRPCDPLSPMRPMPKIQLSGPHPLSRERPHHDSKFYTKSSPPRLKW